ncbi:MAG: PAS domain-containing protein [Acidobacteria bacterium]|nr:PAS domain-containing protein [Acidobacteriota bacterium]
MNLLTNPVLVRMALVLAAGVVAFVVGLALIRIMRRTLLADAQFTSLEQAPSENSELQTYSAVIQQLKQQKHELESEKQSERRRAKATENLSAAVLSNLSSGVIFFAPNGLVRQANPAAKQILGMASPVGMSAAELFRNATLSSSHSSFGTLAEMVQAALRETKPCRDIEASYRTPSGENRVLAVTCTLVYSAGQELLGAACLINNHTQIAAFREQEELHEEKSAEMALELKNSLATIAGYARQLAASQDPALARQLAADIASEASHLDRTIGGFLAESKAAKAAGV